MDVLCGFVNVVLLQLIGMGIHVIYGIDYVMYQLIYFFDVRFQFYVVKNVQCVCVIPLVEVAADPSQLRRTSRPRSLIPCYRNSCSS